MGFFQYFSIVVLYQCQGSDIALAVKCPDVLLFKIALDAVFLELADGGQAVHRVPGKPADALGHDEVDASGQGVRDHLVEALAMPGTHA